MSSDPETSPLSELSIKQFIDARVKMIKQRRLFPPAWREQYEAARKEALDTALRTR